MYKYTNIHKYIYIYIYIYIFKYTNTHINTYIFTKWRREALVPGRGPRPRAAIL